MGGGLVYIVERIIDDKVILEKEDLTHILVSLPFSVKSGDVLDNNLNFDGELTSERRELLVKKQNKLWK
jgi:hypothetical protein